MSKNKLIIFISFIFCISVFLIVGCIGIQQNDPENTLIPELIDIGWINNSQCSLPCWFELLPGKSSKTDVISISKSLLFLSSTPPIESNRRDFDAKKNDYFYEDMLIFSCNRNLSKNCVVMLFKENILSEIMLLKTNNLSFEDLIGIIGEPSGFTVYKNTPEAKGCNVTLFWENKKLAVSYNEEWFIWYQQPFRKDLCEIIEKSEGKVPQNLLIDVMEIMDDDKWYRAVKFQSIWKGFIN
jgi:hypothetical protein